MKGTGNKNDNGVLEIGTDEIVNSYQEDTPGQQVEKYLSQIAQVNEERQKKHFSNKYPNPLKGFPYNESKLEEKNCGCGKTPCETYGESYEEVQEAYKLPNIKSSGGAKFSTLEIDGSKLNPKEKEQIMQLALSFNKGSRNNLHGQVEVNSGSVNPAMVKKAGKLNQIRFSGKHDDLEKLKLDIAGGVKTISEAFRPNPELRDVKKLDKMLESAYKSMNKLQNGKSLYLRKCNDGIVDARRALDEYVDAIESGKVAD